MTWSTIRKVLLSYLLVLSVVKGQQIRRRYGQASEHIASSFFIPTDFSLAVVAGSWLYVDGGVISYEAGVAMPGKLPSSDGNCPH